MIKVHGVCVYLQIEYLQNEYEVVDRFAPLVDKVLWWALVIFIELEFLDNIWVSQNPQENFVCDLERAEQGHLWEETNVFINEIVTTMTFTIMKEETFTVV